MQDMYIDQKFSYWNGFGAVPKYSINSANDNERIAAEPHMLLNFCTSAKEAAKHNINTLISITKLWMGNIGSCGNTSCVWQDPKL